MSNNYSVVGFWKGWHCSFNRWLVRYMFIPLGGSRPGRRWNVFVVFVFVAFWHDVEPKLFMWGLLNGIFLVLEVLVKELYRRIGVLESCRANPIANRYPQWQSWRVVLCFFRPHDCMHVSLRDLTAPGNLYQHESSEELESHSCETLNVSAWFRARGALREALRPPRKILAASTTATPRVGDGARPQAPYTTLPNTFRIKITTLLFAHGRKGHHRPEINTREPAHENLPPNSFGGPVCTANLASG